VLKSEITTLICVILVTLSLIACSESNDATSSTDTPFPAPDLSEPSPFLDNEDAPIATQANERSSTHELPPPSKTKPKPLIRDFNKLPISEFKTVEWIELMPQDDLDALLDPPDYITDIEDGSFEDQISSQIQNAIANANDDRYQQALVSTRIIEEMDGQSIRLAGFIVPLEFSDDLTITQFFLVPFFGACIHVPPPPPNQIILVNAPEGIQVDVLYDPFWISGVLSTTLTENEMAASAYSMEMHHFEVYTE